MFYSKKTEYLIRALLVIGEHYPDRKFVSMDKILKAASLPRALTLKLLNQTVKDGFLDSEIGKTGGYRFRREPASITLIELKNLFDPTHHLNGCALGLPFCSETNPCAMHTRWKELRDPLQRFFEETTLQVLIEEYRKNKQVVLPVG